jgi:tRNA (cmo5U34)-methyltransferase
MAEAKGSVAARREFDREAAGYDRTALASMPGYSELHRTLVRGIPYVATRAFRVLELGVGTGALSALVLSAFPHAHLTGFDLSPRMIARARRRLRPFGRRVELRAGRLEEPPEGEFEVIVSALAIHHMTDPGKWRLFRRVFRTLAPGGYFGDGDDHLPEDPVFDFQYARIASDEPAPAKHGSSWRRPQAVWHEHERFDHPCTLSAETTALSRAGFPHVGVPWQFFGQAVVWAYK